MTTPTPVSVAPMPAIDAEVARRLHIGGRPRLRKWIVRIVLAAAAALVVIAGARWWQQRGRTPAPAYLTAPLARGELAITVTATGTLEARNLVAIASEVSGRVRRVAVAANDRVVAGQILAEIDPELLAAQVEQARAAVAQARAQVVQARATRHETRDAQARTEALLAAGVATPQEHEAVVAAAERAVAAVALAQATQAQAEAALRVTQTNLGRTVLRSPIDGVVLTRDVEVGQTVVAAFQSPTLFQIAEDLRAMKVSVDVDEADVGLVQAGQPATFTVAAYLGRSFGARVVSIHNAARLVDRVVTYEAELEVDNADLALRPGMTVTAELVARRLPDALLVPSQALRFTPPSVAAATTATATPGDRIWVLRDGRPVAIAVVVAGQNDTHTAVTGPGLAPGAAVIVNTR